MIDKAKEENKQVYSRIGYRTIYKRLIDLGVFDQIGKTKLQSVVNSDLNEAVIFLSIENGS